MNGDEEKKMYKIYGIVLGEKFSEGAKLLPNVPGVEPSIRLNYYMWCLKGDDRTLLVDTGLTDEDVKKGNLFNVTDAVTQLRKINVDPKGIKSVIVTHLHYDHFSAHHLYPNAIFFI